MLKLERIIIDENVHWCKHNLTISYQSLHLIPSPNIRKHILVFSGGIRWEDSPEVSQT